MAENIQIGLFSGGYNKNFRLFGNKKVIDGIRFMLSYRRVSIF